MPGRGAIRLGLMICEDMWIEDVAEGLQESGAELLLVINGSPFEVGKQDVRLQHAVARVTETGLPLVYLNLVGGQDELVFDGASFALAADRHASIGQSYEPDDGKPGGWSHRGFARAIGRAVGRSHVSTLAMPRALLKAGGRLDPLLRRGRAKLTPDRARYIAHPDWVVAVGACPPADLWRPELDTGEALAETVRWYRKQGWL